MSYRAPVSESLLGLGRRTLQVAIDTVRVGRPFTVFAIHERGEQEAELKWFVDVSDEAAAIRARHVTATSECERYAIAHHEEIRDRDGVKRLAVVVEVGDREHDDAMRMGQPYEAFAGVSSPLQTLGTPIMLGDTTNVLRGSAIDPGKAPAFVVLCPGCGKKNRVSLARVRDGLPKCGACRKELLA